MRSAIDFIVITNSIVRLIFVSVEASVNFQNVTLFGTVEFECHESQEQALWKFNNYTINAKGLVTLQHFEDRAVILENFSLRLSNVPLSDEGIYTCLSGTQIQAKHDLSVNDVSSSDPLSEDQGAHRLPS